MVIISIHYNQLCNRLFAYIPALAYAIEHKEKVLFIFQYKGYDDFFPNTHTEEIRSSACTTKLYGNLWVRIFTGLLKTVLWSHRKGTSSLPIKSLFGLHFSPGWKGRSSYRDLVIKHADKLRAIFSPQEIVSSRIHNELLQYKGDNVLIGIHIRRGDYRECAPKYFYDWKEYASVMSHIQELFGAQKVKFLICSNEQVPENVFAAFDYWVWDKSSITLDLYSLASCDYILGPPSTFSQWASFYGKNKLYVLTSTDTSFSLDDFKMMAYFE